MWSGTRLAGSTLISVTAGRPPSPRPALSAPVQSPALHRGAFVCRGQTRCRCRGRDRRRDQRGAGWPMVPIGFALLSGASEGSHSNEETPVDCGPPLGGVAGRGAVSATAAGRRRPDKQFDTPQYRRYLHRRNDRDVLQRTHRPEHGWLRIARRYRIEQRYWIEQRVWIERWCGWRWHHRIVNSALLGVSATQRIVQLTKQNQLRGSTAPSHHVMVVVGGGSARCRLQ